jgi:uncharacterized protein (TIGR02722 family)
MRRLFLLLSATVIPMVFLGSCTTKVARVSSDSTIDLTGKWNDTDSRLVADEMINDCLNQRWLFKYQERKTSPKVIIGDIVNKSHEHISVETFTGDMQRALINSAKVDFVASKTERGQLREEKDDQDQNASAETRKTRGEETGADVMLIGTISQIVDQEGNRAVNFYQVNLEMVELQTHMKVWIGEKKIKKYVERATTTF